MDFSATSRLESRLRLMRNPVNLFQVSNMFNRRRCKTAPSRCRKVSAERSDSRKYVCVRRLEVFQQQNKLEIRHNKILNDVRTIAFPFLDSCRCLPGNRNSISRNFGSCSSTLRIRFSPLGKSIPFNKDCPN